MDNQITYFTVTTDQQTGGMMMEVTGISLKMGENTQVGEKIMQESITM